MTQLDPASSLCGGCVGLGTCRLGIRTYDIDDTTQSVTAAAVCSGADIGGPGIAHGGWTAAVFDDVLGRLPRMLGQLAVTSELNVRYLRPVPIERDLVVRARITEVADRRRVVIGELRLAETDSVLATARATMVVVRDGHFERHQEWLDAQRAATPPPSPGPVKWADLMDDWQL